MEEEAEETKEAARSAFRRGQEIASLAPINPWDRDCKIQERDSHDASVIEVRATQRERERNHTAPKKRQYHSFDGAVSELERPS
jgi:hypothetical protein